ncbi:MAG: hypothetical protein KGL38_08075 [Gemmatimonadota bacterium]|nr:hypothetical protein [Gemmatimonadota bacterium]
MHHPTAKLLLVAAIIAALAVAGLLLDLSPLVVGIGVGLGVGVLAAYAARLRRVAARAAEREPR